MSPEEEKSTPKSALLEFELNGEAMHLAVPPHYTLLEAIRYKAGLTGTKQGCDKGDCGACTLQIDGKASLSCLTLAVSAQGRSVHTVEGLADRRPEGTELRVHPLQDALDRHDAAQCGFCTPGILMSAEELLNTRQEEGATEKLSHQEVAEAIAGNLCRCTGYTKILDAIIDADEMLREGGER